MQLNICEHVYPAAILTSKLALWSWHHWQELWVCVFISDRNTHSHMLTAFSAHYSQTAYYRLRARYIQQLWCHHRETYKGWGIFCFCFCFPALALTHTFTDVTQSWPHCRPESQLFYIFTLIMKPEKQMIDVICYRLHKPYVSYHQAVKRLRGSERHTN